MKKCVIFIVVLALFTVLSAENVLLEITPGNMIYNYFYPAYINPDNPAMQPLLFQVMALETEGEVVQDYQVKLSLQWRDVMLFDDLLVEPKEGSPYEVLPANGQLVITSQQLIVSEESQYFSSINGIDFDDIVESNQEFQDLVLQLGYFPDGDYVVTVQMFTGSQPLSNPATFTFTIIAPTAITLISPGNPIGLGPAVISDGFPYFVWFSNLNDFKFILYELQGGEENDEEIEAQSEIIYEAEIDNALVFSYPSFAPMLDERQLYAWQIKARVTSPLADENEVLSSNIYLFSISSDEEVNQNNQILINFLQQLQIEGMDEVIALLEAGYNFEDINWHGNTMGIDGLNEFLQQVLNGEVQIKSMSIE